MPADADRFRPADASHSREGFVVAARLTRQKRVDVVLRAVADLTARGVRVVVDVAGDGPERPSLERLAISLGVADRVRFLGMLPADRLAASLESAVGVVLPSEGEGYGLALVEGALCGCVPVGARSGGIPDLVEPGRSGLLFEPGDHAGLARILERLTAEPGLAARLGAEARAGALTRTAGPVADRLSELYGSLPRP